MKSPFKILCYVRKNYVNKNGKVGVMIRITINGEMTQFSSKLEVLPEQWDVKAGKMGGRSPKSAQFNALLDDIRGSLVNHYREIETTDAYVTAEKVRNAFLGITTRQRTLLELLKSLVTSPAHPKNYPLFPKCTIEGVSLLHLYNDLYSRYIRLVIPRPSTFADRLLHISILWLFSY